MFVTSRHKREGEDPIGSFDTPKWGERARYDNSAPAVDGCRSDEVAWQSGSATMNPALRAPYIAIEEHISARASGKLVLDYGSGHGIYSIHPARIGAEVIGLDFSPRSTALAASTARRAGVADRCRYVVGDCERLPFPSSMFDLVLSMGTMSSLRHELAFAELARVVKPGGEVIIADTLGHNPLLNLNRWLLYRRGRRTRWELEHIPTLRMLDLARGHFREVRVEFFDVTTPLLAPFCRGDGAISRRLTRLGQFVDRGIVRVKPLRRLAFKFVCTLTGPIRSQTRGGSLR